MDKVFKIIGVICFCSMMLASCGTIFGGGKYSAHVVVSNNPNAKIYYKGEFVGTGNATFKVNRYHANRVNITLKSNGCQDQTFAYN